MNATNLFKQFIATGCGSGLLKPAPGTWGTLAVAPLFWLLFGADTFVGIYPITLATLMFCMLNFWSASAAIAKWGEDPAQMVLDEWAGFGLALSAMFEWFPIQIQSFEWSAAISAELTVFICSFALFRLFDIIKPLGIARLQQFNGALGILVDDLAAGGLTAITLNVLSRLI